MARSPSDICFLCCERKANKTGSHYTPASFITGVIGERDKEKSLSFDPDDGELDIYFGRDFPQTVDTTIKPNHHVENYIFCSECEDALGQIENTCSRPFLSDLKKLYDRKATIAKTSRGNEFIVSQINSNLLSLFFYSIIWRQCLQQREFGQVISKDSQERLRKIILKGVFSNEVTIASSIDFAIFPLQVFAPGQVKDKMPNLINPNTCSSSPDVFHIGVVDGVIFFKKSVSLGFNRKTGYLTTQLDADLQLHSNPTARIGLIPLAQWERKLENEGRINKLQWRWKKRIKKFLSLFKVFNRFSD